MKFAFVLFCVILGRCFAQPATNSVTLATIDVDGNGNPEAYYSVNSKLRSDLPEIWDVITSFGPNGSSRILKSSQSKLEFAVGESIGRTALALTNVMEDPPRPPTYTFGVGVLSYKAEFLGDWSYTSEPGSSFRFVKEFILGFKFALSDGNHFGWLRFSRDTADEHTLFDLREVLYHPVANESVRAGEKLSLPLISTIADSQGIEFSWNARWGPLVIESTTNLNNGSEWQEVSLSAGGPVSASTEDNIRFFRLRRP